MTFHYNTVFTVSNKCSLDEQKRLKKKNTLQLKNISKYISKFSLLTV